MKPESAESLAKEVEVSEPAWEILLFRRLGIKAVIIVLFILGSGVLAYFLLDRSLMWAAITVCLFLTYFGHIFVRYAYTFSQEGVKVETWYLKRNRKWSEFRRIARFQYGITLITRAEESRFDFFRSLTLYLPADGEKIIKFIEDKIETRSDTELSTNAKGQ